MTRVCTVPPASKISRSAGLTELLSDVFRSFSTDVLMATPVAVTVPEADITRVVLLVNGWLIDRPEIVDDEKTSVGSRGLERSIW